MINDPRPEHQYNQLYTVQYLGNMVGGYPVRYVNLSVDQLKKYAIKSVKEGQVQCLFLHVFLSVSVYLCDSQSLSPFLSPSLSLSLSRSLNLSLSLSLSVSLSLPLSLSVSLSLPLSLCLSHSFALSVSLSLSVSLRFCLSVSMCLYTYNYLTYSFL